MAKENTKKSKKPLLIAGIATLILGVYTAVGYAITGSATFLRDMAWTTGLFAAGTAVGVPVYIGVKALFTNLFTKDKSKVRVSKRSRGQEQEETLVQGIVNIPTNERGDHRRAQPISVGSTKQSSSRRAK